jgi:hypothetical protein
MLLLLGIAVSVLGYVYIGYPALLYLLTRVRGSRPVRQADITPRVSSSSRRSTRRR